MLTTQALDALAVAAAEALEAPRVRCVPRFTEGASGGGSGRRGGRGGGRSGFGRKGATAHQAGKFQGNK
ncbi:g5340 [Coccomyxa elongata]